MINVEVDAGVCGMKTIIKANSEDMRTAQVEIQSDCPDIQKAAEELKELDGMQEVFGKIGSTKVYEVLRKYCKHAACPVPSGIIKAVEAASGLALPKQAVITMEKID
jgi:hypothetical protein